MATTIKWIDNNGIETAHRIYKSSTYFTKDNLPAPLVELGPDITEYVDSAGTDGENWYIVSALLNDYEVFSEPFIPGLTTAYIHDVFGDGSAVATYQFDGDATDLGGSNSLSVISGTETYTPMVIGDGFAFDGFTALHSNITYTFSGITYSFWASDMKNSIELLFEGDQISKIMIHTNSSGFRFSFNSNNFDVSVDKSGLNHWLFMFDGSEYRVYKNSSLVDTKSSVSGSVTTNVIRIGNRASYYYSGNLDQLRIFNRALTQEEVNTLYQEGAQYL